MHAYRISGVVPQGRQIIINLPPDLEAESFDITLEPNVQPASEAETPQQRRVRFQALLAEAGMLSIPLLSPEEQTEVDTLDAISDEELETLGTLTGSGLRADEMIDEDRGAR